MGPNAHRPLGTALNEMAALATLVPARSERVSESLATSAPVMLLLMMLALPTALS